MNDAGDPSYVETLKKASTKIKELLVENEGLRRKAPVAVIGMGCRFPGHADSVDLFWDLLANNVDAVGEIPAARWDVAAYYDADPDAPGKMYTRNGAFVGDVAGFDSAFFGITPREADAMDPQQRLLLEVSWEALEDAALDARGLAGSRTGVFVGLSNYDYIQAHIHSGDVERITAYSGSGVMFSTAAGRLAYFYDFHGPCITTDTACSSSLVSLHVAMQSLRNGECDLALAGGVNLLLSLDSYIALCKVKALSADGRCRTFDAAANGYGRGEGCGLLVLKRLADAERDGNRILAVLAGSAVNHDGRSNGLTAPNGVAQQAVIRAALQDAGIAPEAVDYVEAHGTGTALGDPIEVNALQQVFGPRPAEQPLLSGSVKTNIGHTEAAAGVAGAIKVILALQNRKIPASLHFASPNAHIDWSNTVVRVADNLLAWSKTSGPRVAGVSSFGLSGTNAHVVVTEGPQPAIVEDMVADRPVHILPLSASSPEALRAMCGRYDEYLARTPGAALADVCHSAASRSHLRRRVAITGGTVAEMRLGLDAVQRGDGAPSKRPGAEDKGIVWQFSGQGAQYVGMGRELYRTQPVFRDALDRCSDLAGYVLGRPLVDHLYADDASEDVLRQTGLAQPALFALQHALAQLWTSWGVRPAAVVGHSIGEYAAACVAGVFPLETGLRLSLERGRQMQSLPPGGAMAAVFAPEETVRAALGQWARRVSLAAVNEPGCVTISGDEEAVTAVLARLADDAVEGRRITVSHAFHSPLMQPMVKDFAAVLAKADFAAPRVPLYSTLTGDVLPARGRMDADYWSRQILQPVQFLAAVRALARDGYATFLEIGPTDTLATLTRHTLGADGCMALSSLRKGEPAWKRISASLAELYAAGTDISWAGFDAPYKRRKLSVPTYPFQRQRHWLDVGPIRPNRAYVPAARQVPPHTEQAATEMTAVMMTKVDQEDQRKQLADEIAGTLAEISGFAAAEVDHSQHLMDMGLDSIMLLKLGQGLERRYGVELRLSMLFEELSTIDRLAGYLVQHGTIPAPGIETADPIVPQGDAAPPCASPAVLPPPPAAQALNGEPASLFQQQLHYLSQVAAQNLQSMTDLARQQMAWLGQAAGPAAVSAPTKAPAAPPPLPPAPVKAPPRAAGLRASAPRPSAPAANFRAINLAAGGPLTAQQSAFVDDLARRHIARTPTSKTLTQQSRAVLADWKHTLSFWGQLKETKYPIISARSEGARFWDVDGNEYIDVAMGMGVHFFGHKAPFIHAALERQLQQGIELGTQTALAGKAAHLIRDLTGVERVAFSNTGSEVVMVALRLARAVTARDKIVIFKNSYHGIFDGVLAIEENGETVPIGLGTPAGMIEDVMVLEYGADESLDAIAAHGDQIAAVLVEPVQSRNPDLQPQGFLKKLRRLTQDRGVALVFDEMINGFRIDPGGAQAWFGVQADIVTYGKIVGGGLPIGVIAGKAKFLDYIDGGKWDYGDRSGPQSAMIYFGGTFCRNPVTMAAAHAALTHLQARGAALQREVTARTSAFCDALNYWFERERVPLRAKHFSSQWRLVPLGDKDLQPIEIELLYLLMMDQGVYTWERRISFFSEAHDDADVSRVLDVVKDGIRRIRAGGFAFEVAEYPAPQFGIPSSPQRRLYSLSQRPGGELAYHLPQSFWIDGPLDVDRLEDCFRTIIRRHESLRTSFAIIDGDLVSSMVEEPRFSIERAACEESRIEEVTRDFLRPFDLAQAPLLRVAAVTVAERRHLLLADAHHIVVDGISFNIIARELMALYEGRSLPPVDYDLRGCLKAMEEAGEGERGAGHQAFWRNQLAGELPLLDLPTDHPRPAEPDFHGGQVLLALDASVTRRLEDLSRKAGASLFMLLLAAYNVLLHRLTLQEDILVGGAVSGRDNRQLASAAGMFVNTVVFRNRPNGRMPFRVLLDAVRRSCLDVYDHQDYPFESMARLDDSRPHGRNALFDTMLSYENAGERAFRIEDLEFTQRDFPLPGAMFDLHLDVIEESEVLNLKFGYSTALFRHETIVRWAGYFERIIAGVLDDPDRPLGSIEILSAAEAATLDAWNDTDADYPKDKTLVDLFEEQVAKSPDRPAVICGEATLTYRELNERADRAAHALRNTHRIVPGMAVGIYLDRSAEAIVGILGVLKAGATYVPLDVEYPEGLIDYMIGDSACRAILTTPDLAQKLPTAGRGIAADIAAHDEGDAHDPAKVLRPDDVAYVIYTSGSTGKPKGCAVTHRNVVRLMKNDRHDFDFGSDDVWICAHSFCFDFSVWEMYGALLYGGRVVIARKHEARDPQLLLGIVRAHRVTVLNQTPAAFYSFIEAELAQPGNALADHLRYVIFGGDRLEPTYLAGWADRYPLDRIALVNMYGISETTVHVSYFRLRPEDVSGAPGPSLIGRPLPETRVYVFNEHLRRQPLGVMGELYVGGSGVCSGYLNNPELTAERFLETGRGAGERLYRTGDVGRLRPDGALEYLGRNDAQVQVRGHRVELVGVQQRLMGHPRVEKAQVIDRDGPSGVRELVAYVIGDPGLTAKELRAHLAQSLPDYAIPAHFVPLAAFPLTGNGKLDRAALPPPESQRLPAGGGFIAPRNSSEAKIAEIWRAVLAVPQVSVDDNYFVLGGDSIKALQIVNRMHQAGLRVSLGQVLSAKTVADLAVLADAGYAPKPHCAVDHTTATLTPIQHWLLETHGAAPGHFNNATLLEAAERVDAAALQEAITAVETHHPTLRLTLDLAASPPRQMINPALAIRLEVVELSGPGALTAHATAAQGEFDVTRAPLLRVILYHLPTEDRILVLCHHLVIDGVSWRILLEDLGEAYQAARTGAKPALSPASRPWLDWAGVLQSASRRPDILAELDYWTAVEAAEVPPVPCDFEDGVNSASDLRSIGFEFDALRSRHLLTVTSRQHGTDLRAILLTALAMACRDSFGLERIRVRLEGHGREDIEPGADFSRTIGWFTSLSPVVLDLTGADTPGVAVARVSETLARIPRKGLGYGILRYLTPAALRPRLVFGPEPEIGFNYLGQFEAEAEGGLRVASEATGPVVGGSLRRPEVLEVEPIIVGGRLSVNINYGQRLHARATMERFSNAMAAALATLAGDEPRGDWRNHPSELSPQQLGTSAAAAETVLPLSSPQEGPSPLLLERLGVPAAAVETVLPLSPLQEGMLFHALSGDRTSYVQQFACRVTGPLDLACFAASWQLAATRHRVLRAAILALPGDAPCQVIFCERPIPLRVEDLSGLPVGEQQETVAALAAADRAQGFDLERDPLIRVTMVRLGPTDTEVFWSNHHIVIDGWSITILWEDLMAAYDALTAGRELALPPAPPIENYLTWLRERDVDSARRFWTGQLADCPPPASLPGANIAGRAFGYRLEEYAFKFESDRTDGLVSLAARLQVTLNTLVQSLWAVLLAQYAGTDDVIFGVITSGRPAELAGVERMVGLFLQPIPMRVRLAPDDSFASLAGRMQRLAIDSEPFQHLPLAELQRLGGVRRTLFDHVLVFENYPLGTSATDGGLRIDDVRVFQQMHYDYSVMVNPGEQLDVVFTFNSNVVAAAEFVSTEQQFRELVAAVLDDAEQPLAAINLAAHVRPPAAVAEAGPVADAPGTVLDLVEKQVALCAVAVAVEDGEQTLTYRALDDRATALARVLRASGVGPGVPVALFLANGIDYIVSILAVQKAGGIFVPVDPEQPTRRLRLQTARVVPAFVVTDRNLFDSLSERLGAPAGADSWRVAVWESDGTLTHDADGAESQSLGERPEPSDPMYVMFTSGSTGEPKAILSSHEALRHFIDWERVELGVGAGVRVSSLAPTTFDVSLRDIFLALTAGGTVCVPPPDARRDGARLVAWLAAAEITVVHVVPSVFRMALKALEEQPMKLPRLAHVLFAGEILSGADVDRTRRALGEAVRLRNLYGPSETTLAKCCLAIADGPVDATRAMPVGHPLPGTRVLIVKEGRLAPSGTIGEIYIAPPFRPLGYFHDTAATAERFLACPPEWGGGGTLYRTGDLGRTLADGTIEIFGRLDGQVKVNGIRVELGEIERAVMASAEIDLAVAVGHRRDDGDIALACYYTEKLPLDPAELRRRVALNLPQGIVPHFFLRLDAFPLNLNGKIDRRSLPKPEEMIADRVRYVATANPMEERIAAIWADVLGLRRVGACSPFFAIGGDSLRAIRVITQINREFTSDVTIGLFFERPTVRQIAQYVRGDDAAGDLLIPALPPAADYAVSHAQRRLWILDQFGVNALAYSIPAAYLLEGPLDLRALRRALAELVDRHESLRTTFAAVNGELRQRIHRDIGFRVDEVDLRNELDPIASATALARQNAEHPFDLAQGPLFRASLLALGPDRHVMLVNIHHIVSDARSISVMVEEILTLYANERPLPPLRIHYKDFAAWENARVASAEAESHCAYWLGQLAAPLEPLELPLDRPRPPMPRFRGDRVAVTLDYDTVRALKQFCEARHGTPYMALVASVKALLHRHTGQQDIVVGSPIASRDREELQHQVGFYVNTLALRGRVTGDESFAELFLKTKTTILAALEHRLYPFDRLVEELKIPRDVSRSPIFEVMVVLQEGPQRTLALDGVRVSEFFTDWKISKFSLTFEFVETACGEITLNLEYDTDLFDRCRIERLAGQLSELLSHAVADPACPLRALDILPASERRVLSGENPVAEIPRGKTIVSLFDEAVAEFPTSPAVVAGDVELSYADLDDRAGAVTRCLADRGVGRGDLVATLLDRSESWVIALLGILKAGAAYLPLDPTYPRERLEYMLMDSGCTTVITEPQHRDIVSGGACTILDVHTLAAGTAAGPVAAVTEEDLAYVIYTSGSTGQPKGVLLEHGGAVNLAFAQRIGLGILPTHRILQFAPSSFDASIWEVLMALMQGACLVIAAPDDIRDSQRFARLLREKRVSVATLPPSYVAQLTPDDLAPLELLVTAGEAPRVDQALMLSRHLRYVNAYGPTESTVCATWHFVDPAQKYDGAIPIGRPVANSEVVVLDWHDNLAPIGVTGEICIGGRGLARGYHGRPQLTAQSFIAHPLRPDARVYRTGDLGYVRPDGEIVYVGRNDRQVKLRGHRIELGEIERCLLRHLRVDQAVVDMRATADGTPDLVAYVVASPPVSGSVLRDHLARQLPAYMVPAAWVLLDAIPLMANGKVDHAALPCPNGQETAPGSRRSNGLEKQIAEVWRTVLNNDAFGLDDRFFEVGGDSIKAIQIVNRLRRAGFKLDVRDLLQFPTIGDLAVWLGGNSMPQPGGDTPDEIADQGLASSGLTRISLSVQEFEELFDRE